MNSPVKKSLSAFFVLSGTVIGASFLALPYIAVKSGLALTLGYLFFLTIIVTLIHYFYAEVVASTADFLRLPSYAKIYLGEIGRIAALTATLIGFFGSLLAYIIVGADFLKGLAVSFFSDQTVFSSSHFAYAFLFFILGAVIVFFGKKAVSEVDFLDVLLFVFVLGAVSIFGWSSWKLANLSAGSGSLAAAGAGPAASGRDFINLFLPYGVILSALWGATVIPEMEEILGDSKRLLKKVAPWGVIIPAIFYLFFILVVLGITGNGATSESISGLKNYLPPALGKFLFFFGLIVVFTSYVSIGLALRNMLRFDLGVKKRSAWAIACFAPFLLYLAGFRNFISVIGFVGAIALAIEGILIILMYNKIKGYRWLTLPLVLILAAGIIYEIFYFVNF
jgi:amino acid permease